MLPMFTINQRNIVLACLAAACGYGAIHDQFTVRMSPEYFTMFHPRIFPQQPLTLLAICWGIAATLPVGLVLGVVLARVAESPGADSWPAKNLLRPLAALLTLMTIGAATSGVIGYELTDRAVIAPPPVFGDQLPESEHPWLMAVWFTHAASYFIGVGGGVIITTRLWLARGRPAVITVFPQSIGGMLRLIAVLALSAALLWLRIYFD